jgi:hypothetical protein
MNVNGTYHYWTNGAQSDITESFRLFTTPELATVIESIRHAASFGSHIKVIAHYKENQLKHFEVEWQNINADAVKFATAHYQFEATEIHVHRNLDGREFHERLPKPQIFTVLPLLRVFTGKAIREVYALGHGQPIPVLVPNIKDPTDAVQLLALELSLRSAVHLGKETLTINHTQHPADLFNFHGGNYDQSAKFWVGENDILLKYEWQQGDVFWEVKLVNYDR